MSSLTELKLHLDQMKSSLKGSLAEGDSASVKALLPLVKKAAIQYCRAFVRKGMRLPYWSHLGIGPRDLEIPYSEWVKLKLSMEDLGITSQARAKLAKAWVDPQTDRAAGEWAAKLDDATTRKISTYRLKNRRK